jgi:hypothetical protein
MSSYLPFQANSGATAGKTVTLAAASTSTSVVISITAYAPTLMVVARGPVGVAAFVRLSSESAPTATVADIPVLCNTTVLLGNPVSLGSLGVAVICSLTSSPVNVSFAPGQGGG